MDKFLERGNVLLGYSHRGSLENSVTAQSSNSDDLDFNDVFGGPPRRSSMQEVKGKYSFGEPVESDEKPVFGTEVVTRRRNLGDSFFNDIFGGEECYSSPKRSNRDLEIPLGSNPGSRISSPGRALTPKAEASGTSLPAQFSLPAKLNKATDYPTFASGSHRPHKMDGITNVTSSPNSSNSTLSRFSSQAISGQDETRNDVPPVHHRNSLSNEDSTRSGISDQKDVVKLKNDSISMETQSKGNQFHFSIYKWPGREFPMLIPLRGGKISKLKEMSKIDRSASSNGRIESVEPELSTVENHGISTNIGAELKFESEKHDDRSTQESVLVMTAKEANSLQKTSIGKKIENVIAVKTDESHKPEVKSLHALIDEFEQQEVKGNLTNLPKEVIPDVHAGKVKINEGIMDLDKTHMNKASLRTSLANSEKFPGRSGVKGKVKDFVKIFNQETSSRSKVDPETPNQSSKWKGIHVTQPEIEVNLNAAKLNNEVPMCSVNKMPDVSNSVTKNLSNDEEKHYSRTTTPINQSKRFSTAQKDSIPSESLPVDSKISAENADDPFELNFVVQVLSDDSKVTLDGSSEDMEVQASDAKIQQWSLGKKGNIRSLLSTLQFVLWPGSGWKPVPLVDLIEANSVKRSYQKALLYLHPDKLQQKGAASRQKYIAEKVFDILQEAWDHFNTIGM